jgi:hypothetical protein
MIVVPSEANGCSHVPVAQWDETREGNRFFKFLVKVNLMINWNELY